MTTLARLAVPLAALLFASCTLYVDDDNGGKPGLADAGIAPDATAWVADASPPNADAGNSDGGVPPDASPPDDDAGGQCSSIFTEFECILAGCDGVYRGVGCSCNASGACSCSDYAFLACE